LGVVLDHQLKTARLVSRQRFAETAALLPQLLSRLGNKQRQPEVAFRVHGEITCNFTAIVMLQPCQSAGLSAAGDCYQVNLAQRFSAHASGDAFDAYLALRQLSAALTQRS